MRLWTPIEGITIFGQVSQNDFCDDFESIPYRRKTIGKAFGKTVGKTIGKNFEPVQI